MALVHCVQTERLTCRRCHVMSRQHLSLCASVGGVTITPGTFGPHLSHRRASLWQWHPERATDLSGVTQLFNGRARSRCPGTLVVPCSSMSTCCYRNRYRPSINLHPKAKLPSPWCNHQGQRISDKAEVNSEVVWEPGYRCCPHPLQEDGNSDPGSTLGWGWVAAWGCGNEVQGVIDIQNCHSTPLIDHLKGALSTYYISRLFQPFWGLINS